MNKAVFIDRDGVINNDSGLYYIYTAADFKLNDKIIDNICLLRENGYIIVIISNQGGIGKGLYTKKDADKVNDIFLASLKQRNCEVEEIYYCPHHPDAGNCLCRKPQPLLFEKAMARFNINPEISYMIGDSPRDIDAAAKAGIKGILVKKNTSIEKACFQIIEGRV